MRLRGCADILARRISTENLEVPRHGSSGLIHHRGHRGTARRHFGQDCRIHRLGSDSGDSSCKTLRFCAKTDWGSMSGNSVVLCGEKSGTSMPWNFQIFRGNASGENIGAAPKAHPLLSSGLSQTPVFIGFFRYHARNSEVPDFHGRRRRCSAFATSNPTVLLRQALGQAAMQFMHWMHSVEATRRFSLT